MRDKFTSISYTLSFFLLLNTIPLSLFPVSIGGSFQEVEVRYDQLNDQQKAEYGLTLLKNLVSSQSQDMPVEYIDFAIAYYKKQPDKTQLGQAYTYKAAIHANRREYPEATQCLLYALDYIDSYKNDKLPGQIYFLLGRLASFQDEFESALNYLDKAEYHYAKSGSHRMLSTTYTVRSWIYSALEDFEKAIEASLQSMKYTTDSIVYGDALNDIGSNYYYLGQADSALYYTKKSLDYPYLATNLSLRYYHVANAYHLKNQLDSARRYAQLAIHTPIDIHIEEECYRILIDVATQLNDDENLRYYIKRKQACIDSIMKLKGQVRVSSVEQMHTAHKENQLLQRNYKQLFLIMITVALLIVGLIVLLFIRNRKKEAKVVIYEKNIEQKEEELSDLTKALEEKQNQLINQIAEELKLAREKQKRNNKAQTYEEREYSIYNEVLHLDKEEVFLAKFNNSLNNLPDKLKELYPPITHKEIIWCCLFMIDIPTKDIALLLHYTPNSLYKFKQRLGHKLGINGAKQLEKLLNEMVSTNSQ